MPDFTTMMSALRGMPQATGGQFGGPFGGGNFGGPQGFPTPAGQPIPVEGDGGIGGPTQVAPVPPQTPPMVPPGAAHQPANGMFNGQMFGGHGRHGGLMGLVNSLHGQLPTLPEGWTPYPTENSRSAWRDWVQSIRSMPGYTGGNHPLAFLVNGGAAAPATPAAPGMVPGVPGSVSTMPAPAQGIAVGEPNPAGTVGSALGVIGATSAGSATTLPTY